MSSAFHLLIRTPVRNLPLTLSLITLALLWLGPLPTLAPRSFAAHMTMHMALVAVSAPLLALGVAGRRVDPVRVAPILFAPIPASIVEMVVVWGWHAPMLHQAARVNAGAFALEQASFLASGLLLWLSVFGGREAERQWRSAAGVIALVFTSMHMTLLGTLFALTPRPLYAHEPHGAFPPLTDLHLGGALMVIVGGLSYLAGGLWLMTGLLRSRAARRA